MREIIILVFFVSILSESCTHGDTERFPRTISLKGSIPEIEKVFLQGLVHIYDSLLILTNTPKSEKQIHLFNKNTYNYICSNGSTGRGPGEISNPFSTDIEKDNGIIWFMDQGKKRFWKFSIGDISINQDYKPTEFIPIEARQVIIYFSHYRDNLFYYVNEDPSILASFFDIRGNLQEELQLNNEIGLYSSKDLFYQNIRTLLYYFINHHPVKQLFVVTYRYSDLIVIVDDKGGIKFSSRELYHDLDVPDLNSDQRIRLVSYVRSNEKFIYRLYNSNAENSESLKDISMKEIHIYNWEAKPVAKINLDHEVFSFDIDYENGRIVTFSKEAGIVYYELPKNLY
ncbi:MAG TPA: hypothetical protein DEQ09_11885 [Bacteroidales bacterium]|nr:hypothetical protein [Bacteroidales bacterium]